MIEDKSQSPEASERARRETHPAGDEEGEQLRDGQDLDKSVDGDLADENGAIKYSPE